MNNAVCSFRNRFPVSSSDPRRALEALVAIHLAGHSLLAAMVVLTKAAEMGVEGEAVAPVALHLVSRISRHWPRQEGLRAAAQRTELGERRRKALVLDHLPQMECELDQQTRALA